MSYQSNYKTKKLIHSNYKNQEIKLKQLSIDDNLYLLALVGTSNFDMLKQVVNKYQNEYDFNFNFIFRVPVQDLNNVVEEVSQTLELNEYFYSVDDFMKKNKLMKRLFCFFNINKLASSIYQVSNSSISDAFSSSSYGSSTESYSYENTILSRMEEKYDSNETENINEIINDSIINNKFFELNFLHIAIILENYEIIKFLLRNNCIIGKIKQNQIHSIHLALYQNNNIILNMLLSQLTFEQVENCVINKLTDDRGYNPVQIAIYYGNESALELLKAYGMDFNYDTQIGGYPLIWALENIDIPYNIVSRLLALGAEPNIIDKTHGYTPLIVAVIADRPDLVKLLIQHGADVNKTIDNQSACCALQIAIDRANQINNYDCVNILLNSGANPTFYNQKNNDINLGGPLIDAISMNNKYLVEKLLSYGSNAMTDVNGTYSPFCTACYLGYAEIIDIFLNNNVNPVFKCKNTNTPLTIAISMNHENIVDKLLPYYKNKEIINQQDSNGDHALLYASLNKNSKLVKRLLGLGADANLANKYNVTPLWYSIYNSDIESFITLLPYTRDLNASCSGIDYHNFQYPPEIIYQNSLSYIELAEIKDCYQMIYFLKLLGATVPPNIRYNILIKLKNLKIALIAKLDLDYVKINKCIDQLECLSKFLSTPLSLTRLCRIKILIEENLHKLEMNDLPVHIENFIKLKKL